ncbi:MAG: hypothetical protein ABSE63_13715 [Thermoguttaceae bacterium]|jgi:hypothetical protein
MMLAGTLFIALMTPFVLYCAMRWHLVGHFGLVAFGGVSASGLATELLDAQILEGGLPAEIQPLAEQIYRARQEAGMKNAFYSGKLVNLYLYDRNYGDNTFRIAVPISQRMYGKDSVLANERLTEFSHAVISQRKGLVLLWAAETYPRSVLKLVAKSWVMILMIPLVLVVHGMRRYWFRRQSECEAGGANRRLLVLFSLLAVSMFLANLTLVIMSGVYADSRYVVAGAVLVPCPLAYVLFSDLKAICGAKREAVEMDNRIVNSHPSRGD